MKKLVLALTVMAMPAGAQVALPNLPLSETQRMRAMDAGALTGTMMACAADPQIVYRKWRFDENSEGVGAQQIVEFSFHYLAGLMAGQMRRIPSADCAALLRAMQMIHGG